MDGEVRRLVEDAQAILQAGVAAAEPRRLVARAVAADGRRVWFHPKGAHDLDAFARVIVVGAGKAAGPMAQGLEDVLGDRISGGVIAVPAGTPKGDLPKTAEVVEAEHPVPGEGSRRAARAVGALAAGAGERDLVVALVSGGASSLLAAPEAGVAALDLAAAWRALLDSGLDIHAVNAARKHLTALGGGKLARIAFPATLVSLILSDVPGDRLDCVGSGPTVADPSTFHEARSAFEAAARGRDVPEAIGAFLARGEAGLYPETPKPGDPLFQKAFSRLVGSNAEAVAGALVEAQKRGYADAGDFWREAQGALKGSDARAVGRAFGAYAAFLQELQDRGYRDARKAALVAGGEAPVAVAPSPGQGGRLSEFVLSAAEVIAGRTRLVVAALATDGKDGAWQGAGAVADPATLARGKAAGLDPQAAREASNTGAFFAAAGGVLPQGPTRTNVGDLYLALLGP